MCVTRTLILTGSRYGHVQCWSHSVTKNENFKRIAIFSQEEFKCKFSFINVGSQWQHGCPITAICCSELSLIDFSFDEDGYCVCSDLKHMQVLSKFCAHAGKVNCAELLDEEGLLLTGGCDCVAKIWRIWIPKNTRTVEQ